ncbi:MAG: hypothetical protein H0X37_21340 [Herpetosiphonaceae bacterium]|nr:hypothetical protein [Herpetosiphonaceae bacterium]
MLKRREQRPRLAVLQRQRRASQQRVNPPAAITLDQRTIRLIVEKLDVVCTRFKARELYSVLHILEQALRKANEQ